MDTGKELIRMLVEQKDHYDALKHVVVRQATHIETMDVGKLASDTAEVRGLMRKVRDLEASIRPLRPLPNNNGQMTNDMYHPCPICAILRTELPPAVA